MPGNRSAELRTQGHSGILLYSGCVGLCSVAALKPTILLPFGQTSSGPYVSVLCQQSNGILALSFESDQTLKNIGINTKSFLLRGKGLLMN